MYHLFFKSFFADTSKQQAVFFMSFVGRAHSAKMLHCFKVTTHENRLMIRFLQGRRSSYRYYDIYGEMTIKKRLSHIIKKEDDT